MAGMREARIKIPVESGDAVYHCITRVVNGERVLDEPAREVLRKQLWQVAEFCGVRIHTYAILSNHFHVLVMVPQRAPLSDAGPVTVGMGVVRRAERAQT